ncbi:MAG: hypothetical protein QXJ68_00785 [Methanocellales archaeon]
MNIHYIFLTVEWESLCAEYYVIHKKTNKLIPVVVDWAKWEDRKYLCNSERWKNSIFGWRERANDGCMLRVLKDKKTGEVLGVYAFSLDKEQRHLYIDCIESIANKEIRLVGTTLMKDAVEQSILHGFEGRVKLTSRWDKDEARAPEKFFSKIGMLKEEGDIHCLEENIHFWKFYFDEQTAREFLERYNDKIAPKPQMG